MKLILALLFTGLCFGQTAYFAAYKATTLSSAVEAVTVQQPASGSKTVRFEGAYIYCSAACVVTLSVDGTAATTTALTPVALARQATPATPTATAYHTSNAGSGTTLAAYDIAAGGEKSLEKSGLTLFGDGTARNFTLKTNSISGSVRILVFWSEQ
jgi:hypothetical protein